MIYHVGFLNNVLMNYPVLSPLFFNKSFQTGTVPVDWLTAVVTPVPKIPHPTGLTDYRPISVTPILSRVAEKIVVRQWLRPAITADMLADQFGFRPTGSTTSALVHASCNANARK